MGAPDERLVYSGGELIANPTSAVAPSYGGTRLGLIQQVALFPTYVTEAVPAEEYGGEAVEEVHLYEEWFGTAEVANYDGDAIAALLQGVSAGTGTPDHKIINVPGPLPGDLWVASNGLRLLLAPREAGSPGFLFYNCIIRPAQTGQLDYSGYSEVRFFITWRGFRNATDQKARLAIVADLGL